MAVGPGLRPQQPYLAAAERGLQPEPLCLLAVEPGLRQQPPCLAAAEAPIQAQMCSIRMVCSPKAGSSDLAVQHLGAASAPLVVLLASSRVHPVEPEVCALYAPPLARLEDCCLRFRAVHANIFLTFGANQVRAPSKLAVPQWL